MPSSTDAAGLNPPVANQTPAMTSNPANTPSSTQSKPLFFLGGELT